MVNRSLLNSKIKLYKQSIADIETEADKLRDQLTALIARANYFRGSISAISDLIAEIDKRGPDVT